MSYTPNAVVPHTFPIDQFVFTYNIAAGAATDVGKAVEIDKTAAASVKLATDGAEIFGRIFSFEDRSVAGLKVAAIERKFKAKLPATTGHGIVVGDAVCGAGAGLVRKAVGPVANDPITNVVIAIGTDFVVVEQI